MRTSRRIFLKSAVGLTGAATAFHASAASRFLPGQIGKWKLADTKEYLNICCYCSGGCGTICSVRDGQLINIEGDPDNPVNLGGLWPPFLLPLHQRRLRYGLPDRLLKVRRKRCGFRFSGKMHRLPLLRNGLSV